MSIIKAFTIGIVGLAFAVAAAFIFHTPLKPEPVNPAVIASCLEKGWKPKYYASGRKVTFVCEPLTPQIEDDAIKTCIKNSRIPIYETTGNGFIFKCLSVKGKE